MNLLDLGLAIADLRKANLSQVPRKRTEPVKYIVIHFLGVANADNPDLYGGGYGGHFYVSRTGKLYCAADPDTSVTWHCGGGRQSANGGTFFQKCTNANSVGIEIGTCHDGSTVRDDDGRWYFSTSTQEALIKLVKALVEYYSLSNDRVIRHYDVTGKYCPAPYVANNKYKGSWTWGEFKSKLKEEPDVKNPEEFVRTMYLLLFHREVDEGGLKTWVDFINNGGSADDLINRLYQSDELIPEVIKDIYTRELGREPKSEEVKLWKDTGLSIVDIVHKVKHSREYAEKGESNGQQ